MVHLNLLMSKKPKLKNILDHKKAHPELHKDKSLLESAQLFNESKAAESNAIDLKDIASFTDEMASDLLEYITKLEAEKPKAKTTVKTQPAPSANSIAADKIVADLKNNTMNKEQAITDRMTITSTTKLSGEWGKPNSVYINGREAWVFYVDSQHPTIVGQTKIEFDDLKVYGTDYFSNKFPWEPSVIASLKALEQKLNGIS